jgi:hypothetical protein
MARDDEIPYDELVWLSLFGGSEKKRQAAAALRKLTASPLYPDDHGAWLRAEAYRRKYPDYVNSPTAQEEYCCDADAADAEANAAEPVQEPYTGPHVRIAEDEPEVAAQPPVPVPLPEHVEEGRSTFRTLLKKPMVRLEPSDGATGGGFGESGLKPLE